MGSKTFFSIMASILLLFCIPAKADQKEKHIRDLTVKVKNELKAKNLVLHYSNISYTNASTSDAGFQIQQYNRLKKFLVNIFMEEFRQTGDNQCRAVIKIKADKESTIIDLDTYEFNTNQIIFSRSTALANDDVHAGGAALEIGMASIFLNGVLVPAAGASVDFGSMYNTGMIVSYFYGLGQFGSLKHNFNFFRLGWGTPISVENFWSIGGQFALNIVFTNADKSDGYRCVSFDFSGIATWFGLGQLRICGIFSMGISIATSNQDQPEADFSFLNQAPQFLIRMEIHTYFSTR